MLTSEDHNPTLENKTPFVSPGTYSPVTVYMRDTWGAIFLGILAGVLLLGWTRAETRYRALMTRLEIADGDHSPNSQ
jgi:hypothetical protein